MLVPDRVLVRPQESALEQGGNAVNSGEFPLDAVPVPARSGPLRGGSPVRPIANSSASHPYESRCLA